MKTNRRFVTILFAFVWLAVACTAAQNSPVVEVTEANEAAEVPQIAEPAADWTRTILDPAANVPLEDALPGLEPPDVFQNFYDLTRIPRQSGDMERIRAFLMAFGEGLGLETLIDEAGNVLIRKPATPGMENRQGVVLQAHMDMVAQVADGVTFDFSADPIPAFVNGDILLAEGTSLGADNGIGMAMIMAVLQSTTLQAGPIEALFTVDEETDMSGTNGLKSDLLQGRILINLDSEEEGVFTIGSAGGAHATVQSTYPEVAAPAGLAAYQVTIQGLKGGHSGLNINLGRGHATKLLVRLLDEAADLYGLRLAAINGGTAFNAIPTDATALVLLPAEQVAPFSGYVKEYEATIRSELSSVEPKLTVSLAAAEPPDRIMDEVFQANLLDALYAHPQGVMRMSDAVEGLVETSTNMGVADVRDGQLEVVSCPRSSVDSSLVDVNRMMGSVWELAGYSLAITDAYKGWKPDPESPIVQLMEGTYRELFGQEPVVSAVHAGLECGVIGGIYPEMDMISIGPTMSDVHSVDERLYIPSVAKVQQLMTEVLQRIPDR